VADQVAAARQRVEAEKKERLADGRVKIKRKREVAEARVGEVAEFLVQEFERAAHAGMR